MAQIQLYNIDLFPFLLRKPSLLLLSCQKHLLLLACGHGFLLFHFIAQLPSYRTDNRKILCFFLPE